MSGQCADSEHVSKMFPQHHHSYCRRFVVHVRQRLCILSFKLKHSLSLTWTNTQDSGLWFQSCPVYTNTASFTQRKQNPLSDGVSDKLFTVSVQFQRSEAFERQSWWMFFCPGNLLKSDHTESAETTTTTFCITWLTWSRFRFRFRLTVSVSQDICSLSQPPPVVQLSGG